MTPKITGEAQIETALFGKVPLGRDPSGWETLYYDPATGTLWELTYPQSEMHGGGPRELGQISAAAARVKYVHVRDWEQPLTFTKIVQRFQSCCPVCQAASFDYQPGAAPGDDLGALVECPECGWKGMLGDRDVTALG